MKIDCVSDLHGYYPKLDGGDLLIIAGDLTSHDTEDEYHQFLGWAQCQQYQKIVVIAGNHDNYLQANPEFLSNKSSKIDYLCDSGTEFEGLKIWGSPWTSWFHGVHPRCKAFMVKGSKLNAKWNQIPPNIDILVTHNPLYGVFDAVPRAFEGTYESVGCMELKLHVTERIKPKLHVFGHIHEHGGKRLQSSNTLFVNASYVNEHYKPVNSPVRVDL